MIYGNSSSKFIIQFSESPIDQLEKLKIEILKKGFDSADVQSLYQDMVNVSVLFGADKKNAQKEMKAAMQLYIQLANFTLPDEQKRNESATSHLMPLSEVQKLYPEVPLVQYIKTIVGVEVTGEEVVNVQSPTFITKEISMIHYS